MIIDVPVLSQKAFFDKGNLQAVSEQTNNSVKNFSFDASAIEVPDDCEGRVIMPVEAQGAVYGLLEEHIRTALNEFLKAQSDKLPLKSLREAARNYSRETTKTGFNVSESSWYDAFLAAEWSLTMCQKFLLQKLP